MPGRLRFTVNKQKLNIDTPENRFIKSVIKTGIKQLVQIEKLIRNKERSLEAPRLSESFFKQLLTWQNSLQVFHRNKMFMEVGNYTGLTRESLVLQQKPGYAKVYRVWQKLKWYFELLGNDASLSLRNIAELYEVWCFLEIRDILLELGFQETISKKAELINNGLDVSMKDGLGGAFKFERDDGIKLRLAHEPIFKQNTNPIKVWLTPQEPDIFLEAIFPDGSTFIWLFDAKYRIKPDQEQDLVPDDAINQLHRYRDALIHQHKINSEISDKTRPIFGAYALYPGFYDQKQESNYYQDAIIEIGIGAFSLLPSENGEGSLWLRRFIEQKLAKKKESYEQVNTDHYYVEESIRIPYKGTTISRYHNLTLAVGGGILNRTQHYKQSQNRGGLKYYHMQAMASERQKVKHHVIKEMRFLAIALDASQNKQEINYLYPILNATLKKRGEITEQQTGTTIVKDPDQNYWLFELGKSFKLGAPVEKDASAHFELKITDLETIMGVTNWKDISQHYPKIDNNL